MYPKRGPVPSRSAEGRRAASSRVPYLSLNERKVGRAQAPRQYEGLWKTDRQESVIPPFSQTLDAIAHCNNSGHISRYGVFRARSTSRAPEPTQDHCAETADRAPSETLRTQMQREVPAVTPINTSLSSLRSSYFPHIPGFHLPLSISALVSPGGVSPLIHQRCLRQLVLRRPLPRSTHVIASSLSRFRETSLKNLSCSNTASTTTRRNSQLIMDRLRGCQLQQTCLELHFFFKFKKLPVERWSSS